MRLSRADDALSACEGNGTQDRWHGQRDHFGTGDGDSESAADILQEGRVLEQHAAVENELNRLGIALELERAGTGIFGKHGGGVA